MFNDFDETVPELKYTSTHPDAQRMYTPSEVLELVKRALNDASPPTKREGKEVVAFVEWYIPAFLMNVEKDLGLPQ